MNNGIISKNYSLVNETLNAVTHGIGTALSIVWLVLLIQKAIKLQSTIHLVSYIIFGISMIILFLASTLYHSLIFTKARNVFQVFDHSSIYLLIAGSYTPFCLLTIKGKLGWTLFTIIWIMAISGVVYKSLFLHKKDNKSVFIYIAMGWLCLVALKPLYTGLGLNGVLLLAGGGVAYTIGAIFYKLKNVKFMHVVWHIFVMLGAALIFLSVYLYT